MKQIAIKKIYKSYSILLTLLFFFLMATNILHAQNNTYLVVNLENGTYEYRAQEPDLTQDTCRTTELWLRRIPKGVFTMGSVEDNNSQEEYFPAAPHDVTITEDYYIGIFECTQKQWELIMGNNPSVFLGDTRPVENIPYDSIRGNSWPDNGHNVSGDSFMYKLNEITKLRFDLPTEAEWEYACRAGGNASFMMESEFGRYSKNREDTKGEYTQHTVVGQYASNKWNLYDMYGNVREWCLDWYDAYDETTMENPSGPHNGTRRVVRGGNWMDDAKACHPTTRKICRPSLMHGGLGFRIVCHYLPAQTTVPQIAALPPRTTLQKPEEATASVKKILPSDIHPDDAYLVINLSNGKCKSSKTAPDLSNDTCRTKELWLRRISTGTFKMGSPQDESGRNAIDETQHTVTLTKAFYIGVFECTQAQWEAVMGGERNPSKLKGSLRPVDNVPYNAIRGKAWPSSRHDVPADSFMGKLREISGLDFDLPTEAQWEYACRAGTGGIGPAIATAGRFSGNVGSDKGGQTGHAVVGSYEPNAWGLYDMRGNIAEWCLDWFAGYNNNGETDPPGPQTGTERVLRGGNWNDTATACRPASRYYRKPTRAGNDCGFRVVCPAFAQQP